MSSCDLDEEQRWKKRLQNIERCERQLAEFETRLDRKPIVEAL